jgi:hypothetical protein
MVVAVAAWRWQLGSGGGSWAALAVGQCSSGGGSGGGGSNRAVVWWGQWWQQLGGGSGGWWLLQLGAAWSWMMSLDFVLLGVVKGTDSYAEGRKTTILPQ